MGYRKLKQGRYEYDAKLDLHHECRAGSERNFRIYRGSTFTGLEMLFWFGKGRHIS